jgi:DNA repair exonuclease SbcCD ATPase subunit
MFDVGSLIGISKSFLETFAAVRKLLLDAKPAGPDKTLGEMREKINQFQSRLEGLAIQLEQTERLTRMIPAWEAYANQIQAWKDMTKISDDEAQQIHVALRQLVDSSIRDQFSGTFFRTDFDHLPDMRRRIDIFRAHVMNLDRTCSGIPAGNLQAFRSLWSSISTELNNLKNAAYDVRRHAEDVQAQLIDELLKSSQEARKFLAAM